MVDATVIIAAWRAEDHLSRALQSALRQTDVALETVVVDDASPDGTLAVAEDWARRDSRVRVVGLKQNSGPAAARNAGLDAARGRWACILDADDAMLPERLSRMMTLGEAQDAAAVFDDFQPVDEAGRPRDSTYLSPFALRTPVRWDLQTFLAGCQAEPGRPSLGYLKPILRVDFLRRHGLRYDETLRNGEDFHLLIALLAAGGAVWVTPDVGYLYTMRTGSISSRLDPEHAQALAAADAAFLERHAAAMPPEALRLMRRRQRRLGDLSASEAVFHALRAGRPGQGMVALIRRPRAAGRLFRQAGHAVMQRLTRLAKPRGQRPG